MLLPLHLNLSAPAPPLDPIRVEMVVLSRDITISTSERTCVFSILERGATAEADERTITPSVEEKSVTIEAEV